jgi:hypothetical protein
VDSLVSSGSRSAQAAGAGGAILLTAQVQKNTYLLFTLILCIHYIYLYTNDTIINIIILITIYYIATNSSFG